jgi:hypothetical protein
LKMRHSRLTLITSLIFRTAFTGPVLITITVPNQLKYMIWGHKTLLLCQSTHFY